MLRNIQYGRKLVAFCMSFLFAVFSLCGVSLTAADYVAPRASDGVHPDLNGIWQAMNEAHYDLELHIARASLQLRDGPQGPVPSIPTLHMGAVGAVPPGMGVVVGANIPYKPEALLKKKDNQKN